MNATNEFRYSASYKNDDVEKLCFLSTIILGITLRIYCGSEPKRLQSVESEVNFCVRCCVLRHIRIRNKPKVGH
jgi:hypothetical protein